MYSFIHHLLPYAGNFPYKEVIQSVWAGFDGAQYIVIASHGYLTYQYAYFPLYPLLIKIGTFTGLSYTTSALVISNLCWAGGMYCWYCVFHTIYPSIRTWKIIIWMNIFPTAFFYHAAYTESLFLLLSGVFFYARLKKHISIQYISGFLLGITRLVGGFAVTLGRSFVPILGVITYMGYLWYTTGNPLSFFSSQAAFKNGRSTSLVLLPQVFWRYIKIFYTTPYNFLYFVAMIEVIFFIFVLILIGYELYQSNKEGNVYGVDLVLFSFASIILPTLTGTFASIPRYALLCFAIYPAIARLHTKKRNSFVLFIFIISTLLQTVLCVFFLQGYFIS